MPNRRLHPNRTQSRRLTVTPTGASTFEHLVATLGLSPEEYEASPVLRDWVRRNKDHRYVPSVLLQAWGFKVDTEA